MATYRLKIEPKTRLMSNLINREPIQDDLGNLEKTLKKLSHIQYAAQVLKLVLDKWATPVNQLKLQTHKALREYLNDPKSSFISQYGVITALIHLGPKVLVENLLPQLNRYLFVWVIHRRDNSSTYNSMMDNSSTR